MDWFSRKYTRVLHCHEMKSHIFKYSNSWQIKETHFGWENTLPIECSIQIGVTRVKNSPFLGDSEEFESTDKYHKL